MTNQELTKHFKELGEKWLKGYQITEWTFGGRRYEFFPQQIEWLNSKQRYQLGAGGLGSGKTLVMIAKMLLLCWFFPQSEFLLGRRYMADLEKTVLPILWELIPPKWHRHKVREQTVEFFNGSKIIFFGLDALQSGSQQDIKKANQSLKGLNLSGFALDQCEEIEKSVFDTLRGRLRRTTSPIQCGLLTCNPANFWSYPFFVQNKEKRKDIGLFQFSMLDNPFLPKEYIADQLNNSQDYIDRYVKGNWDLSLLLKGTVFDTEQIKKLENMIKEPSHFEEGFKIFRTPDIDLHYRIGVDVAEGSETGDNSAISVVASDGSLDATFCGKLPIPALTEKVKFIYNRYTTTQKPLVIPEANACGQALILGLGGLRMYKRTVFDTDSWGRRETTKLGFKTSAQTKSALVSNFQNFLRQGRVKIYDKDLITEMKTFCWNDSAKQSGCGASRGFTDDLLISCLLAYFDFRPVVIKTALDKLHEDMAIEAKRKIVRRMRNFE